MCVSVCLPHSDQLAQIWTESPILKGKTVKKHAQFAKFSRLRRSMNHMTSYKTGELQNHRKTPPLDKEPKRGRGGVFFQGILLMEQSKELDVLEEETKRIIYFVSGIFS